MTATVVEFPEPAHARVVRALPPEPASIIIMPVVRIERHPDDPAAPRRRRRRAGELPSVFASMRAELPRFEEKVIINGQLHEVVTAKRNPDGTVTLTLLAVGPRLA